MSKNSLSKDSSNGSRNIGHHSLTQSKKSNPIVKDSKKLKKKSMIIKNSDRISSNSDKLYTQLEKEVN